MVWQRCPSFQAPPTRVCILSLSLYIWLKIAQRWTLLPFSIRVYIRMGKDQYNFILPCQIWIFKSYKSWNAILSISNNYCLKLVPMRKIYFHSKRLCSTYKNWIENMYRVVEYEKQAKKCKDKFNMFPRSLTTPYCVSSKDSLSYWPRIILTISLSGPQVQP